VVYRDDFEFAALLPGVFSSIIAFAIFGGVYGYQPLFAVGAYHFHQPLQLVWFAIIGLLAGGIGLLYSTTFYGVVDLSKYLPISRKLRPAIGALFVGLIALGLPEVLGTGYGWVQKGLSGELTALPLYIIIALPFARIVATALSIGTGGSGGVFGPGMVIGAFTGLAVWRILGPIAPAVGHDPGPFVVVGMMSVFGGISRAPIAVALMVAEMTGNISILAPAMVAIAIAWFIVTRRDATIYRSQVHTRADSTVGRLQAGLSLLPTLRVADAFQAPHVVLHDRATVAHGLAELERAAVAGAPVVDSGGTYLGTVTTERLRDLSGGEGGRLLSSALDASATAVNISEPLDVGLDAVTQAGGHWVTVTGGDRRVVGVLSMSDLVRSYRRALDAHARRMTTTATGTVAVEEPAGPHSPLTGRPLRDVQLPPGSVVVTVQHGRDQQVATGGTVVVAGDVVSALASPSHAQALRAVITGAGPP